MDFFKELQQFIKQVASDKRIPLRDKRVLLVLLVLIISPVDLIPDWIPFWGLLDDVIYLALFFDFLFNILDDGILLSHYPWGLKSFVAIRRPARFIASLAPSFLRNRLWKYEVSPYRI